MLEVLNLPWLVNKTLHTRQWIDMNANFQFTTDTELRVIILLLDSLRYYPFPSSGDGFRGKNKMVHNQLRSIKKASVVRWLCRVK
ncbi:hypothetical protein YA53_05745 [Enterobacter kobei]|nr:hypothetical protein ECNIH4_20140 [Enterobacter cloacae]KJM29464.1 hypothetical protein SS27_19775 [Enterobacter kobei]OWS66810.1 hypothetical protein WM88_10655 [Enterobacter cloacae complex sp. ECNIH6]POV56186.1 hypothetical protein C3379_10280 [Enterobacter cloacae complex sp. ECNIH10]POV82766.1 hypothetical protein C3382_10310 [Enterobacter cloacae complex sp. ECNIH9]